MSTRAPGPTVLRHPIGRSLTKLLGWDEILQAFARAAIVPSVRPVYQGERTNVQLLRRSVAPAKAGRGTRGSPGSHPVDGWRRESACAQDSAGTREHQWPTLGALARPRSSCEVVAPSPICLAGLIALEDWTSHSAASANRRRFCGARDSRNGEMSRLDGAGLAGRFPVSNAPQGQHAVVPYQVESGRRHERRELGHELERLEQHVS
jgi:hypothetical protein